MKKGFKFGAIAINAALMILVFAVFIWRWFTPTNLGNGLESSGPEIFKFFTTDSNLILAISCGIYAVYGVLSIVKKKEIPCWVHTVKTVGTASTTLTALVVLLFLEPQWIYYGGSFIGLYQRANFFFHFLVPLLGLVSYILLECEEIPLFRATFFAMIPSFLYGLVYLINIMINGRGANFENDFYGFATWGVPIGFLLFLVVVAFTYLIALGIWFARKATHLGIYADKHRQGADIEFVNYREPDKKVIVSEEIIDDIALRKAHENEEVNPNTSSEVIEEGGNEEVELVTKNYKTETGTIHSIKKRVTRKVVEEDNSKQFHISQHLIGWQVKLEGEDKPTKVFRTQKDAIEYAKAIVKEQGGIIFVHTTNDPKKK